LFIFNAVRDTVVVSEVKLVYISVQVMMPAVLVYTLHATLEYRKESLNGIGVYAPVKGKHILANSVHHRAMISEVFLNLALVLGLIGHDLGLGVYVLQQDRDNGRSL